MRAESTILVALGKTVLNHALIQRIRRAFIVLWLIGWVINPLPVFVTPVQAATTINVSITTDVVNANDGKCSLREAIDAANRDKASGPAPGECLAGNGADTIFLSKGITYTLTLTSTGDLEITRTVTLNVTGVGNPVNAVIQGGSGWNDRIFRIYSSAAVNMSNITIRGGRGTGPGGGVHVASGSALTLTNGLLRDNVVSGQGGGGIFLANGSAMTITNSAVISNTATSGGGGGIRASGVLTITNSTISSNSAFEHGGGIFLDQGVVNLNNVTIAKNVAGANNPNGGALGGGVYQDTDASLNFGNTIIAENTSSSRPDCSGTPVSQGYNLIGNDLGCIITGATSTNLSNLSPHLGPLQLNGGQTPNHALFFGSPAIGAGGNAICEKFLTDQRGQPRIQGVRCDIGAYEYPPQNSTVSVTRPDDPKPNGCLPGDCSLREAIIAANAAPGTDIIILPPGFYELAASNIDEDEAAFGDLDITSSLALSGAMPNTTKIVGNLDRVLHITGTVTVTIAGLTIERGNADSGGGIRNNGGALTLTNTVIQNNEAGDEDGGGLLNIGGTTVLINSAIITNTSATGNGGGAANLGGTLIMTNTTLSGNQAALNGGGLIVGRGTIYLNAVTLADNATNGEGGGVFVAGGTITLKNSLIADNTALASTSQDCAGTLSSQGGNLIEDISGCGISGTPPLVGFPGLDHLQNNGSSTPTHALQPNSPALGKAVACLPADQRGATRPQAGCDIGAFELPSLKLSANSYRVSENITGGRAVITATLDNPTLIPITVTYTTTDGTAQAGKDYSAVTNPLMVASLTRSVTFTVPIMDDIVDETDETFTVTLTQPNGVTLATPISATVIIANDPKNHIFLPLVMKNYCLLDATPNNGFGNAVGPLAPGSYCGFYDDKDDVFTFTLSTPGTIELVLDTPLTDTYLVLYNCPKHPECIVQSKSGQPHVITQPQASPGTYYIRVNISPESVDPSKMYRLHITYP